MIPKIIHFIYGLQKDFGGKPFSLVHYLAIKSTFEVNKPEKIQFFYVYEPTGRWWNEAKKYLELIHIDPLTEIFGRKLSHFAHQADVLRLLILIEYGGIYLDLDTLCVKPFDDLLHHPFVIGQQGTGFRLDGLCNAVLLAEKDSFFAKAWLNSYQNFRSCGQDAFWDEHSVRIPLELSPFFAAAGQLHIEPYTSFHYPHYQFDLDKLFETKGEFPKAYCHHLWETETWDKYLKDLSVEGILANESCYAVLAQKFLN